ncbi:MAG: hypothetical protein ACR2NV_10465 [Thermoleophilaceae bacterium]
MHVLFVLYHPGYLRFYDSVIALLAERGHRVSLAWSKAGKKSEGLEALALGSGRVEDLGQVPTRTDLAEPVAFGLRAVADYVRYLDPTFAQAEFLRRRYRRRLPRLASPLKRLPPLRAGIVERIQRALILLERAGPRSPAMDAWLSSLDPDLVVVSPLVADYYRRRQQADVVGSARALGIPSALGVASWDHLTTKGRAKVVPDRVLVWNERQREEAERLHGIPPSDVVVTGAQLFDRWFDRRPSTLRAEFCAKVGLEGDRPFVLFVGSTRTISDPDAEQRFVRSWIGALRASTDPAVRDLAVLVRPHPHNSDLWAEADLSDLGDVSVWPRGQGNIVDEDHRAGFFDSLHYSAVVVGINTSAMIEAAIVGRPVLTVRAPEFASTQGGTVHFHYLLPEEGGFVRVADSLEEHAEQLGGVLHRPEAVENELRRFVEQFVRPLGLDTPGTPRVVDALEALASAGRRAPSPQPLALAPLRAAMRVGGVLAVATEERRRRRALRRVRKRVRAWTRRAPLVGRRRGRGPGPVDNASGTETVGRRPERVAS